MYLIFSIDLFAEFHRGAMWILSPNLNEIALASLSYCCLAVSLALIICSLAIQLVVRNRSFNSLA